MQNRIVVTKIDVRSVFSLSAVNAHREKAISQEGLADLLNTSSRWIQLIESGRRMPGFCLAVNLMVVLELDPSTVVAQIVEHARQEAAEDVPVSQH